MIGGGPGGRRRGARGGGARRRRDADRARRATIGGQLRLAGRAPAHRELWRALAGDAPSGGSSAPASTLRLEHAARPPTTPTAADVVVLATGARPYVPPGRPATATGRPSCRPASRSSTRGRRSPTPRAVAGPVLVADWGGGWDGPRRRRGAGRAGPRGHARVRGAVPGRDAPPVPAQPLPRPLRRARHRDPPPHGGRSATGLRHLFSGRERRLPGRRHARLRPGPRARRRALGRARGPPGRVRAGDVLGPRSAEEATLEGVRPARCSLARRASSGTDRRAAPAQVRRASRPSRWATPAASVRERTSSLARIRETCTLAVFSAM